MSFFDRLFGRNTVEETQPNIKFGRYTDSYKTRENYKAWDDALHLFEKKNYLTFYREFFHYLRDIKEKNVSYWEEKDGIGFELYQGSKKISGFANDQRFKAEAKVVKADSLNVGFMRRLMEKNFNLKYTRFALDAENNICIVFTTYTLDGSPYKLYYALKELATNADKQDDLLLDEFDMLRAIETSHLQEIPLIEKEAKYQFITKKIQQVFDEIEGSDLSPLQYPGAIAYLMLNLIYRLDYLTKPEGYMMEVLERVHRLYFAQDTKGNTQKNSVLKKELKKLLSRPKEEFFKEMYRVVTTFGITAPVNHDKVISFIDGEINNMDWYKENNYHHVALAIPGYIVGYCLFNFAVPKPDRDLLHLYFQIMEADYFRQLGFSIKYRKKETKALNKKSIRKAIDAIVEDNKEKYPSLKPATGTLNFDSDIDFAKSYLMMIRNMEVVKVD